jgi:hypothetical protein
MLSTGVPAMLSTGVPAMLSIGVPRNAAATTGPPAGRVGHS